MIRVLCVSPRFAPSNAADSHRLRLLLRHAEAAGWQAEVLAVAPEDVDAPVDAWLAEQLPTKVLIHRVRAIWSAWPIGSLAWRAGPALCHKGSELLASGRFDLVFFSTTEFHCHWLGVWWQRRHGVPFCMDYQDPWVNDYYRCNPQVVPPGGRFKYGIMNFLHRCAEPIVTAGASGFLAVSQGYIDDLRRRYGVVVSGKPVLVRGFPGDLDELSGGASVTPDTTCWRYIGRGGVDMQRAFEGFLRAWQLAQKQELPLPEGLAFEACGTSYAVPGQGVPTLAPVAVELGMTGVTEHTDRLSYSDMLLALRSSGALIVFGSDDPAYTASKIYPYLLAGRPLLAIFHERSSVVPLMRAVGGGICVTFADDTSPAQLADRILQAWFVSAAWAAPLPLDLDAFTPFSAAHQAKDLARWFQDILASRRSAP